MDNSSAVLDSARRCLFTGDCDAALAELAAIAQSDARRWEALLWLAQDLPGAKRYSDAIAIHDAYLARYPCSGRWLEALLAKADCLLSLDQPARALSVYRTVLAADPDNVGAQANQFEAMVGAGRFALAVRAARTLQASTDTSARNAASALLRAGYADEAATILESVCGTEFDPGRAATLRQQLAATSNYVFADPAQITDAHAGLWSGANEPTPTLAPQPTARTQAPERPLRVGLLSADWREHSVAWFLLSWLGFRRNHPIAYVAVSTMPASAADAVTALLRDRLDGWVDIAGLDDPAAATRVRDADLDVLVDLAGLTGGRRSGLLALRPAPVQAEWLGYPASTGHPAVDWRLTDPDLGPGLGRPDLVLRHAHCYGPPPIDVDPTPPPDGRDRLAFGSFNALTKLSADSVALWSRLLESAPTTILILKDKALGDPELCDLVAGRFATHGIGRDRLTLLGRTRTVGAHLAHYRTIDVALDPLPYSGATTTCESLWMGVPVVTMRGAAPAARLAASMLRAAGCEAWIADGSDGYCARARSLLPTSGIRTAAARHALRARVLASPLCDGRRFAADLAATWRLMWRRHCAGLAPAPARMTPLGMAPWTMTDTWTVGRTGETSP